MEPAGPAPTTMMSYALAAAGRAAWSDDGNIAPAATREVFLRNSRLFTVSPPVRMVGTPISGPEVIGTRQPPLDRSGGPF
jgi:hypothetical protein